MKITASSNLSFDLLCFLNVATEDEFYLEYHREEDEKFYPLLSDKVKAGIKEMAKRRDTMLWPLITLLVSSLENCESRELSEMLTAYDEIREGISKTPYKFTDEELGEYFREFREVVVPFAAELNEIGFVAYWHEVKKPLIDEKCQKLNEYFKKFNILDEVKKLMKFEDAQINMWVCAFARPIGAKLCGYDMVSDYTWSDDVILRTITHEIFHPPYKTELVADAIEKLGQMPWVVKAYDEQNPNCAYKPMEGFIEENVVEALGIYIFVKMIPDFDAHGYFKEHDYGSHVISTPFYDYLHSNPKPHNMSFEDYFIKFVEEF